MVNLLLSPSFSAFIWKSILPSFVYFTAFVSKFMIICLTRIESPYSTGGRFSSTIILLPKIGFVKCEIENE